MNETCVYFRVSFDWFSFDIFITDFRWIAMNENGTWMSYCFSSARTRALSRCSSLLVSESALAITGTKLTFLCSFRMAVTSSIRNLQLRTKLFTKIFVRTGFSRRMNENCGIILNVLFKKRNERTRGRRAEWSRGNNGRGCQRWTCGVIRFRPGNISWTARQCSRTAPATSPQSSTNRRNLFFFFVKKNNQNENPGKIFLFRGREIAPMSVIYLKTKSHLVKFMGKSLEKIHKIRSYFFRKGKFVQSKLLKVGKKRACCVRAGGREKMYLPGVSTMVSRNLMPISSMSAVRTSMAVVLLMRSVAACQWSIFTFFKSNTKFRPE